MSAVHFDELIVSAAVSRGVISVNRCKSLCA